MTLGYNSLDEKTKSLIHRVFTLVELQVQLLLPFYYKTGTMGRIGSTSYVLPIRLSYRTLNRVMRVVASFWGKFCYSYAKQV